MKLNEIMKPNSRARSIAANVAAGLVLVGGAAEVDHTLAENCGVVRASGAIAVHRLTGEWPSWTQPELMTGFGVTEVPLIQYDAAPTTMPVTHPVKLHC